MKQLFALIKRKKRVDNSGHMPKKDAKTVSVQKPPDSAQRSPKVQYCLSMLPMSDDAKRISEYVWGHHSTENFSSTVLKYMEEKKIHPREFYKRSGMDRKLFSAMKAKGAKYQPSRNTAIRCCFALRLSIPETENLLRQAGYALSQTRIGDLVISYCLENEIWNLMEVDELLFCFLQEPLTKA